MDGNFQHRHNILASKDNPEESKYPARFVRPSQIAPHNIDNPLPPPAIDEGIDDPCGDAHKTANDTRGASTWDQCDDTGLFAMACRHDVPLLMANIYKSGEKMCYPLSLLKTLLDDHPEIRVGVLYDIGCHLDKHITKHNKIPEYQRRLMLGTSVFHAYVHSWGCQLSYNPRFLDYWGLSDGEGLERLWSDLTPLIARLLFDRSKPTTHGRLVTTTPEQHDHNDRRSPGHAGHMLSGFLNESITSPLLRTSRFDKKLSLEGCCAWKNAYIKLWELGAFNRLARLQDLATQIADQRRKVGISETLTALSQAGQDLFLKVWFAKTEVRTRFITLRAEQRPLDRENRVGGSSRLGTHEKERIMTAIQRRTRTMKKTLNNYNRLAREFQTQYPDHPTSPAVEYSDLIQMEADDPVQRGQEELRRLGWEIRRAMRWATQEHERLWTLLDYLRHSDVNHTNDLVQGFINHEILESLSTPGRVNVIKGLAHTALVRMTTLTFYWDTKAMQVLMRTPPQTGDFELMTLWKSQLVKIRNLRSQGFGSLIHGDFENLFGPLDVVERHEDQAQDADNDSINDMEEEEWANGIDEGMLIRMMKNVGLEKDDVDDQ
ncbi:hypothetical protein DFH28DRAFT_884889 [Melampsora americana]|nr:hypothetical protein DFH28DRAFT_907341 [Melampsora americana]KAH9809102.1 hypothetical protein DFH28DRAFT_906783 [Melampsora americana]KAH9820321.1 hypothetical protein DFH28DRAFT_884889 [Melampsora americana]